MNTKEDALQFIEELSKETGVQVNPGLNVFFKPQPMTVFQESIIVFIDPSGLSLDEEDRVTAYAGKKGLIFREEWNDWGRYLKIWKIRQ